MGQYLNAAAYRFAVLTDLRDLRGQLLEACRGWGLRGTILISPEGINLFVAGPEEMVHRLLERLRKISGLEGLEPKFSWSDHQPFRRMLVRIKREIIAFGVEGINPAVHTAPRLAAKTLKQWLDEGRQLVLLDTRNDYEIKLGTFEGAIPAGIDHFRDFPEAVRRLPEEWKGRPIVTFCTGGIRCEKASPLMEREGFQEVYQLEGGILKYLETVSPQNSLWQGECFVFDERVCVGHGLVPGRHKLCRACRMPLADADQESALFETGVSCPKCHASTTEQQKTGARERQRQWEMGKIRVTRDVR